VDPHRDPTIVGRRLTASEWEYAISEPDELSRTLPLDTHAPVPNPLPFTAPSVKRPRRRRKFLLALGVVVGILVGALLQRTLTNTATTSSASTLPSARYGASIAAMEADQRYQDWLTVQSLAAQEAAAVPQKPGTAENVPTPELPSQIVPQGAKPVNSVRPSMRQTKSAPATAPAQPNRRKMGKLPF
jgi:hypothetical protein